MSFVFYDCETTGIDTSFNQILQFGAIRTDENLNELERFEIRCQILPHIVPAPQAMLVTRVTAQQLIDKSLPTHYQMMVAICEKLRSWSPSIFLGYNTLNYDEHLLRQSFYQTLHPLYLTNTNGNGRSDVLRMMQATSLFAPETIEVPRNEKGDRVFKLDRIAPLNGFKHENAHDAMADVEATIHLCRIIMQKAPDLWSSFVRFSRKTEVAKHCNAEQILSFSEFYFNKPYSWLVSVIGANPEKPSDILVFDLANNPDDFVNLTAKQIADNFKKLMKPVRSIKCNASPILAAAEKAPVIAKAKALGMDELRRRAAALKADSTLRVRLTDAYNLSKEYEDEVSPHVEKQIYNGFIATMDEHTCDIFHQSAWEDRVSVLQQLSDVRLLSLAHRLMYCERADLLDEAIRHEHDIIVARRLLEDHEETPWLTLPKAIEEIDGLIAASDSKDAFQSELLNGHRVYLLARLEWAQNTINAMTNASAA